MPDFGFRIFEFGLLVAIYIIPWSHGERLTHEVVLPCVFVPLTAMDEDLGRIWASFKLFAELSCLYRGREEEDHNNYEEALELVDEDMMRCHIINCLTALLIVQIHRCH
jgi:hypothetical protein